MDTFITSFLGKYHTAFVYFQGGGRGSEHNPNVQNRRAPLPTFRAHVYFYQYMEIIRAYKIYLITRLDHLWYMTNTSLFWNKEYYIAQRKKNK